MNERTQIEFKLLASHIILPVGCTVLSFLITQDGFLTLGISQTLLFILFFAGYWEFFGQKFRWIFLFVMELLLVFRFSGRFSESPNTLLVLILAIFQLFLVYEFIKILLVIFLNDKESIEIEFPFKDGTFLITDGGNSKLSRLMNYHFHSAIHKRKKTNGSMLYAADIIKIVAKGSKFLPLKNEDYAIYDEVLYSPIAGIVVKVVNNIDDNIPFSGNYPYNTGNTIVIKKDNYYFLFGHLRKGSIIVNEGDGVNQNQIIANAGNSGMSERPHLHMQLIKSDTADYWSGKGICIRFKKRNLYKNRIITI
jgi:hypothetical protein